jgi:hypothetical protein
MTKEMNDDADAFYDKLVKHNEVYGTGLEEDVLVPWRKFGDVAVENNDYLLWISDTMREIARLSDEMACSQIQALNEMLNLTNQLANAQAQANSLQSHYQPGIRSYFENQGYDVNWNASNSTFTLGNQHGTTQAFSVGNYTNLDGRLQATYEQLLDLERQLMNLPRYDKGGRIPRDMLAVVHKDEEVLPVDKAKAYRAGRLEPLEVTTLPMEQFGELISMLAGNNPSTPFSFGNAMSNAVNSINNSPSIYIDAPIHANGVTSEKFLEKLPGLMKGVMDKGINELKRDMNNTARAGGVAGGVRASKL